jgi:transcriptional regulator with XRE-family HTH domain
VEVESGGRRSVSGGRSLERMIGERLRTFRLRRGFTQRSLAGHVAGGVDLSYVGRIERGEQLPSLKVLRKLGGALGISPGDFFESEPLVSAPVADRVQDSLWRALQRVPRRDLPILLAIAQALAKRRGTGSGFKPADVTGRVAAESRRRYRVKRAHRRSAR